MDNWIDRAKQKVLVGEREAARILGVSLAWLKRSAEDGTIPHVMVGRSRMYPWEKCRDILIGASSTPAPAMPQCVAELVEVVRSAYLLKFPELCGTRVEERINSAIAAVRDYYASSPPSSS